MNTIKNVIAAFLCLMAVKGKAQSVAVNSDGSSAIASSILDVKSTTKGVLIPRMSKAEKNAIVSPANGLLIYQATPDSVGFYYYDGTTWLWLQNANNNWSVTGNGNTDTAINFLGNINSMPLRFKLNNQWAGQWDLNKGNYAIGLNANKKVNAPSGLGERNISIGNLAGSENSSGIDNIAIGENALQNNTDYYNIAIGSNALRKNVIGFNNVAVGFRALDSNVSGTNNNAIGTRALQKNRIGFENVAIGVSAMQNSVSGGRNVVIGSSAGFNSLASFDNVFIGYYTGANSIFSSQNVAIGDRAMVLDTAGFRNVAIGSSALTYNTRGYHNTAIGAEAGYSSTNYDRCVFLGYRAGFSSNSSDKLYIENSSADSTNALIYGDFTADSLSLNGKVNIKGFSALLGDLKIVRP
jgi:trimeric autotransporter adhesin